MENFNLSNAIDYLTEFAMTYGLRLLGAIVVLIIGWKIIGAIKRSLNRTMEKREMKASLKSFLSSVLIILLRVMLIISVLSMLGVAMTSFIAILGAFGLAIGLALSGTLQNFAGGVMILLFNLNNS
jgi:small conductance mechanosensitive channel